MALLWPRHGAVKNTGGADRKRQRTAWHAKNTCKERTPEAPWNNAQTLRR